MVSQYGASAQQLGAFSPAVAGQVSRFGPAVAGRPSVTTAQPTQDTGGFGFGDLFSGERVIERLGFGPALEQIGGLPVIGPGARAVVEEVASPFNIAAAAAGARGVVGPLLQSQRRAGRMAGGLLTSVGGGTVRNPVTGAWEVAERYPGFAQRLAAEAVVGLGARTAAENLELPGPLKYTEPFIGGAFGLLALRRGQLKAPGVFGAHPRHIASDLAKNPKYSDVENAVADHEKTFAATPNPSPLGLAAAQLIRKVPILESALGDFVSNPQALSTLQSIDMEYRPVSDVWQAKLMYLVDDSKQRNGLFAYDRGSAPGLIRLDDINFNQEKFRKTGEIDDISFKQKSHNDDVEDLKKFFEGDEKAGELGYKAEVEDAHGIDYDDLLGKTETKNLTLKDFTAQREIPVGELIAQRSQDLLPTYRKAGRTRWRQNPQQVHAR